MQKITQKQLDKMLSQCFQEEARRVEVPSSKKLWADLQERLESAGMQQIEEKLVQLQQAPPKKKQVFHKVHNIFWRKHKYLTGLAAACLVMLIISLQVAPSSGMSNFVQRFLTFMGTEMSTKPALDDQNFSSGTLKMKTEDAVQIEESGEKRELPIKAGERAASLPPPAEGAVPQESAEAESYSLFIGESPDQIFSVQEEISGQKEGPAQDQEHEEQGRGLGQEQDPGQGFAQNAMLEETLQESILYDKELFFSELNDCKDLAPEKIWRIDSVPEGFAFNEAVIARTDTFLHSVSQKYTNEEDKVISLSQKFFPSRVPEDTQLTTSGSLAHPIQVGLYSGYIICEENGIYTITWKQNNSIVALSGQLAEKELFDIIDALIES
ncbi:MAG: DUF4367 domain-containing protein [Firmicutes bacterium]|jgi:hypothetical protein|nr:DUF4367 domain-containing protein [Bacillota bacterium]